MNFDVVFLLIAFCGGAFGAAIGALPAFAFCGFIGLVGVASGMAGSNFNWHGLITFGPFFGPQISFAGAVGAAAFAKKMGYLKSGKDIAAALMGLKKAQCFICRRSFWISGLSYSNLYCRSIQAWAIRYDRFYRGDNMFAC